MKQNNATKNRPQGDRVLDAPSVYIDLPAYVKQIKSEEAWHKSDRNSITVFKSGDLRIVVGALHQGAEMPYHEAEGLMSVHVLEGALELDTDETCTILHPSNIMAIHKDRNYCIKAREESVYVLTISDVH